jgi:membrane-associated phospholipid phosphatase
MIRRPDWLTPGVLRWTRWVAVTGWVTALWIQVRTAGIPFDREAQIIWLAVGLAAASLGRRAPWSVVIDWLPFGLVLIAYDFARGASDSLGMPTWWSPQITVDKALFGGRVPTVWLQERLKYPEHDIRWWDVVTCLAYISFFFLPYVTAAVFWLRSRAEFRRWAARFVSLSFLGFGLFALIPAAPPWAAAKCSSAAVADHPADPACLHYVTSAGINGGMLGKMTETRPGAAPFIERLSYRGWSDLHISAARSLLIKGQGVVDPVAAVPSLHAAGTMLFAMFLWRRSRVWWKAVLVAYNLVMAFALVYAGEHYVADILAGWLVAALVSWAFAWYEQRRNRRARADRLTIPALTARRMESLECPPTATTPSST